MAEMQWLASNSFLAVQFGLLVLFFYCWSHIRVCGKMLAFLHPLVMDPNPPGPALATPMTKVSGDAALYCIMSATFTFLFLSRFLRRLTFFCNFPNVFKNKTSSSAIAERPRCRVG